MGNVIPTAAQYGITVEDLGAAYVVLTKQGINTARSTTYLRSAFTELEKEGSDASEALKNATGKSFMQLMKEGKNLGQIMQILRDSVNGDEEAFIHLFGSVRTAAGALALANTSAYEYNEILNDVSNSNGQAARNVQKLQTPTLKMKKAWEQLKTSGIELGQELIELLAPSFEKVINAIKKGTEWFKKLSKGAKAAIATFVAMAGALGPAVVAFGKLTKGIGGAIKVFGTIIKGSASLTTGLTAVAGVLALIASAAVAVRVQIEEQEAEVQKLREAEWGLTEDMKEHIEASKELVTQSRNVRSSAEETVRGNMAEAQSAQALLGQLRELYDENGKVLKGKELQAEFIKGSLAEALGIEIGELDKLIEKNGIYSKSIDEVIEAELRKANTQAYIQAYEQQIQKLSELQFARDQAFDDFKAQSDKEQEALGAAKLAWDAANDAQLKYENGQMSATEVAEYWKAWEKASGDLQQASTDMEKAKASYENLDRALDEGSGQLDYFMQKYMEASGMTAEEAQKATEEASKSFKDLKDAHKTEFDQIVENSEKSMGDFQTTIETARNPIKNAAKADADAVTGELKRAADYSPQYADQLVQAYYRRLTSQKNLNLLAQGGAMLGAATNGGFEKKEEIHSPSKVWMEYADNVVDGHLIGLANRYGDLAAAGRQMAMLGMPDSSFTNSYSRTAAGYGVMNNNKTISAPISVNVNVNGNLDNPQSLVDSLEEMLVEKIIRNERVFA